MANVINFDQRKAQILHDLASAEPDRSPAGKPDAEIEALLALINSCDDWVTTSSCAGRYVVFAESHDSKPGEWLFITHETIDWNELDDIQMVNKLFGGRVVKHGMPDPSNVFFKFEPGVSKGKKNIYISSS